MISAKPIFEKYDAIIKNEIRQSIKEKGLTASGKSAESLTSEITDTTYKLFGVDYFEQMQNGRGPTTESKRGKLYGVIQEWIDQKGIVPQGISKKSLAYLIARKIDQQGIRVPNQYNKGGVISDVLNDELLRSMEEDLSILYIDQVKSDIRNILNVR